jgi:hypothetical protein
VSSAGKRPIVGYNYHSDFQVTHKFCQQVVQPFGIRMVQIARRFIG